jgi:hypothetical protein
MFRSAQSALARDRGVRHLSAGVAARGYSLECRPAPGLGRYRATRGELAADRPTLYRTKGPCSFRNPPSTALSRGPRCLHHARSPGVLILERSDRVPYIRLPTGDRGFEFISLHRWVSKLSVPLKTTCGSARWVPGPEGPYPQLHHCSRRRSRPGFPAAAPRLGQRLLSWTWMEHSKKHKGAGRKFIDQGRHRPGARHRDGHGQRRRRRRWRKWRSDKARMAFLEEKGCVSWDISAAPRRSGREYYGNEPK